MQKYAAPISAPGLTFMPVGGGEPLYRFRLRLYVTARRARFLTLRECYIRVVPFRCSGQGEIRSRPTGGGGAGARGVVPKIRRTPSLSSLAAGGTRSCSRRARARTPGPPCVTRSPATPGPTSDKRRPVIDHAAFDTVALHDAVDPTGQATETLALFGALRQLTKRQHDVMAMTYPGGLRRDKDGETFRFTWSVPVTIPQPRHDRRDVAGSVDDGHPDRLVAALRVDLAERVEQPLVSPIGHRMLHRIVGHISARSVDGDPRLQGLHRGRRADRAARTPGPSREPRL